MLQTYACNISICMISVFKFISTFATFHSSFSSYSYLDLLFFFSLFILAAQLYQKLVGQPIQGSDYVFIKIKK